MRSCQPGQVLERYSACNERKCLERCRHIPESSPAAKEDSTRRRRRSRGRGANWICTFVGKCRERGLRSDAPSEIHVGRPDLDNLEKLVMDAATSVLYEDDSQVYFKTSMRLWAEEAAGSGSSIVKIRSSSSGPNILERT